MTDRRDALRTALGRVGVWSFALQTQPAAVEHAALAAYRAAGFRATWVPESLGSKDAFAHTGLLLAGSPDMVIATGIANIHARDPMAMVNGGRALAEAYPGRFLLGLGVSHAPSVAIRGGAYGRPIEQMTAYLDAMAAAAWAGPATAEPAPVVLAALGPRMLELAAERTEGAHPYFVPLEHTAQARRTLGPDPLLLTEVTAVLDADRSRALEVARAFAVRYLALPNYARNLVRLGYAEADVAGSGSDRLIEDVIVMGDVDAIVARVRAHLDAGADHVCVQLRAAQPSDPCLEGYRELAAGLGKLLG